ncbi:MAG: alpha-galactosidase [Armatimonadota bacterium]|nr:alpha-galactosidase [Armatimonadota bacterium]
MLTIEDICRFEPVVVFTDPSEASGARIRVLRECDGVRIRTRLVNEGNKPARIHELILGDFQHDLPGDTKIYGEGFTHISLTAGTIAKPIDVGTYTDREHYRLPAKEGATTVYWMLMLSPPNAEHLLLGFCTAFNYTCKFHLTEDRVQIVAECEDIAIDPGEVWYLEDFVFLTGSDRAEVLDRFADYLREGFRPEPLPQKPPTGWCSWYCFGPGVTADDVLSNLDFISRNLPELRYIQIDDGYQAAVGDWLESGKAFGGNIRRVIAEIRDRGFEPAIWVAPFVAQEDSRLFREHPEWFVRDDAGQPLRSDRVTFGGWSSGPWYALDGTHPEVQAHFIKLFNTLRFEWGIKYFKLDACFWGAMHGCRRWDPKSTRIRAYRMGMRAIQRGCDWTFLLAGNHPLWPSMGIFQANRTSNDIGRSWQSFRETARQNLMRAWMNGKVWWNDPDCVVLSGDLSEDEFLFHATAVYASGGSVLSGDDLPKLSPEKLQMLRKMLPPTGCAAKFSDDLLEVGRIDLDGKTMICLFNWSDEPKILTSGVLGASRVRDFWSGEELNIVSSSISVQLPAHSARLLECVRG